MNKQGDSTDEKAEKCDDLADWKRAAHYLSDKGQKQI